MPTAASSINLAYTARAQFVYLKNFARPLLAAPPNESELRVDLIGGARIQLFGGDNEDNLRGLALDGVILDEFGDMSPSLFPSIPALADRKGYAVFIGTIKGRNHLWKTYESGKADQGWHTALMRASQTGILGQDELADARAQMSEEQYSAEFECDAFAAIMGAYYGKELKATEEEGRIRASIPMLPGPIHCAWDFGNGANMAIWAFQVGERGPLIHDFIQTSGCYFDDYLKEVAKRGYDGYDYVPHDAKVPSFETGRTRVETMIACKRTPVLVANHHVDDGINAVKLMLPRTTFNATACASGLEALRRTARNMMPGPGCSKRLHCTTSLLMEPTPSDILPWRGRRRS